MTEQITNDDVSREVRIARLLTIADKLQKHETAYRRLSRSDMTRVRQFQNQDADSGLRRVDRMNRIYDL